MNTKAQNQQTMDMQGSVEVPSYLPASSNGPLYAPCSGMWDGNEKGWTTVQPKKKKSKKPRRGQ